MNDIQRLIENAQSNGIVTTLDATEYKSNDDRQVEIDWDAYPHSLELV